MYDKLSKMTEQAIEWAGEVESTEMYGVRAGRESGKVAMGGSQGCSVQSQTSMEGLYFCFLLARRKRHVHRMEKHSREHLSIMSIMNGIL